ncbi:ABC transporter ATP-binding protein Uup [Legionella brunensis]|uniref:ABC transporter ATP-binding protein Uup n=2 Tax=Legionella brunensis TaxID=29422 RepID=A0A0W0STY3_9GAMM|nr:ABC transporter ATP-binding protein Uup [Legionella brunensis]
MHKPIRFKDVGLSFPNRQCFSDFSGQILYGSRIAIIGRNGAGKSTLLKIIFGTWDVYEGSVTLPDDICIGYLPQAIHAFETLSGGERLNRVLTEALCKAPNLLLLDEPTNHLDKTNRRSLINHLRHYRGTLILVTHDLELLDNMVDTIWHIQHGRLHVFNGNYDDYQRVLAHKAASIEQELGQLQQQKRETHLALMREQERNKRMRIRGEKSIAQRKWPTIRSQTKLGNAAKTGDRRLNQIREEKQELINQMSAIYQPEIIQPKFQMTPCPTQKTVITIKDASVSFDDGTVILRNIDFHMRSLERVAICGDNGSGKSTFVKAILAHDSLKKTGYWVLPNRANIGYLDQHYQNLHADKTVLEMVSSNMSHATNIELRKHLNDFLFRKNEEVETQIKYLSGGEMARLSLCCIAASPPTLLIMDEMTNNLDLETREHVIQVLKSYPGALVVISHDIDFLHAIHIETTYQIHQGQIKWTGAFERKK